MEGNPKKHNFLKVNTIHAKLVIACLGEITTQKLTSNKRGIKMRLAQLGDEASMMTMASSTTMTAVF